MTTTTSSHARNKKLLLDTLQYHELKTVTVSFSGSGDSGDLGDIAYETIDGDKETLGRPFFDMIKVQNAKMAPTLVYDDKTGRSIERDWKAKPPSLKELIEEVCWFELEAVHGGWEIDAGASGTITLCPMAPLEKKEPIFIDISHNYNDDYNYDDDEYNDE